MKRFARVLITFFVGCLIFIVGPILFWGPGDIARSLESPARLGYVTVAIALNAFAAYRKPAVGKSHLRLPK